MNKISGDIVQIIIGNASVLVMNPNCYGKVCTVVCSCQVGIYGGTGSIKLKKKYQKAFF